MASVIHAERRNFSCQDRLDSSVCRSGVIVDCARITAYVQIVRSRANPSPVRPSRFSQELPAGVNGDNIALQVDQRGPRPCKTRCLSLWQRRLGIFALIFLMLSLE